MTATGAGRAGAGGSATGASRGDGIVVVLMVRVSTAPKCGWIARWFARTAAPACRMM